MKSPQQIIRLDGRNVFVEAMNSLFDTKYKKVIFNFIQYDTKKQEGNRQKEMLNYYLDIDDCLLLCNDILSGRMHLLAKQEQQRAEKAKDKYCKPIYQQLSGTPASRLKKQGKSRPDGKSLSRQFKVVPGNKVPFMLECSYGAGKEDQNGLIVPQGYPEKTVRVPLTSDDFKKFAIVLQTHIKSYITSTYVSGEALKSFKDIKNEETQAS